MLDFIARGYFVSNVRAQIPLPGAGAAAFLAERLKNIGLKKREAERKALDVLAKVGLAGKERSSARFLSGGEKRRLAVAGIIALDMPLVIFDEPYANLDYLGVRHVNALIKLLKKKGATIIILTHELEKSLAMLCPRRASAASSQHNSHKHRH